MKEKLSFERNKAFSLAAWVDLSAGNCKPIIAKEIPSGTYRGYALGLDCDTGTVLEMQILSDYGTNNRIFVTGSRDITSEWHHVAATYDGSSSASGAKLYIDGVEETISDSFGSLTGTILTDYPLRVGASSEPDYIVGSIDEVNAHNI